MSNKKSNHRKKHKTWIFKAWENRSRIYRIWALIKARCERPTSKSYCDYGERGISLCEEWHDFLTFKDWAYSHGYSDELTIDRIDINGNYEPSNCRWATTKMQANNQRKTIKITLGEITHSLKEWCEELNLNYTTVQNRRRRGMNIYEAMFTPVVHNIPIIAIDKNGESIEYPSFASAAEAMGVSVTPIYKACSNPDKLYKGYYWRRKIEAA